MYVPHISNSSDYVQHLTSASSLYMIMGRVLDVLYGGNLGCDPPQDVFTLASHVLQIEHQLSEAQRTFPAYLGLVRPADLVQGPSSPPDTMLKFRVVYTMRYYNLRILTHRPLLHRYLALLGCCQGEDARQAGPLGQVGMNSLRICVQSARSIVELMEVLTSSATKVRDLLGAWWFSLLYSKSTQWDAPAQVVIQNGCLTWL